MCVCRGYPGGLWLELLGSGLGVYKGLRPGLAHQDEAGCVEGGEGEDDLALLSCIEGETVPDLEDPQSEGET